MADGRPGEEASALPDERAAQLSALEQSLDVRFRDRSLLELALRHDSFAHERGGGAESLGDPVLTWVLRENLRGKYPEHSEGELAKQRARLVNETALAHLGRRLHLGTFLLLGKGEEKGGGGERAGLVRAALGGGAGGGRRAARGSGCP